MGTDGKGVERGQPADHALLPRQRSAYAGLGSEPRRSRAAHIAVAQEQHRTSDDDGVRSGSRCARGHRAMLSGWVLVAGVLGGIELKRVAKTRGLKGLTIQCAVDYAIN